MKDREIKQRMILMCDLPIGDGSEFKGVHPCVVASVDIRNEYSSNVYVFPITSSDKKWQPTHWKLKKEKYNFFTQDINTVICEEGRSISRSRLQRFMGEINEDDFSEILRCKEFIFYSRFNGIPFSRINCGETFECEGKVYLKVKNGEKGFCSISLKTCDIFNPLGDRMVIPCWDIKEELSRKANKILSYLDNKK